jgi:hypothetical protein
MEAKNETNKGDISSLSLIYDVLEFMAMTPDPNEWSIEAQKNPPRQVRLIRIKVLLSLYLPEIFQHNNLRKSMEDMMAGNFIYERKPGVYTGLFSEMDRFMEGEWTLSKEPHDWDLHDLNHNYRELMRFKKQIYKIKSFNSGVYEMSYPYYYSYLMSRQILEKIETPQLDDFLKSVIDPSGKRFHTHELVSKHNYPDVDLMDLDFGWM